MNNKRIDFLLILLLILISIGLQFYFLNPPVISDQLDYFFNASSFFDKPLAVTHRSLRLGLIIPTAIFIKIFGYCEAAYYAMSFIGISALVAGTYLVALFLFSRTTAVLSAILIMTMPGILLESGNLLPDIPAASMALLAFGMIASSHQQVGKNEKRYANWMNLCAGMLLGWAYLIREFVLFIFPMVILLLWIRRRPVSDLIFIILGSVLIASVEWAYSTYFYSNAFIRFASVQPRGTAGTINRDVYQVMTNLLQLINKSGVYLYTLLLYLFIIVNFYYSLKGRKEYLFLFVWFISGYSLLTLTGLLPVILDWPDKVLLRLHLFRYWIIILPPFIIGGVAALIDLFGYLADKLFTLVKRRKMLPALLISLITAISVVQSVQALSNNKNTIRNGNDAYLEFRDYMKANSNPSDLLWLERGFPRASERIVPIFLKSFFGKNLCEGSIKYINNGESYPKISQLHDGLIVTNTYYNKSRFFNYPDYLINIPNKWPMVFESENGEVEVHRIVG